MSLLTTFPWPIIPPITALIVMLALAFIFQIKFKQKVEELFSKPPWKYLAAVCVFLAAFLSGLISKDLYSDFNKLSTFDWNKWALGLWIFTICIGSIGAVIFKEWVSDEARKKLDVCEKEKAKALNQRNALQTMGSLIGRVIDYKKQRFSTCDRDPKAPVQHPALLAALDPADQIRIIVQQIYQYFIQVFPLHGSNLRFGLYLKSTENPDTLYCPFSWNGISSDCINNNPERLRISDVEGAKSAIMQCFHTPGKTPTIVVSDTHFAFSAGQFEFFTTDQKNYLRSLLVMKQTVQVARKAVPMIFSVDSDAPNYFQDELKEEYTRFFVEVAQRLAYELEVLSATTRLFPSNE